jgi:Tol biopolymer transport system component/DNA-binding winged helix-turn-helix (wHTH) protein
MEQVDRDKDSIAMRVKFGLFEADLRSGELRRSGVLVRLQSQPFKVLAVLLESSGEVVTREELRRRLWGTETIVNFDHSLGIAINKLREALGDSAENPRFVETLARRGYRFIAPVNVLDSGVQASRPHEQLIVSAPGSDLPLASLRAPVPLAQLATPRRRSPWRILWLCLLAASAVTLVLAVVFLRPHAEIPNPLRVSQITYFGHVMPSEMSVEIISSAATDGSRIFFSAIEDGRSVLAQASVSGGEISPLVLPSEIAGPLIGALSPDGGRLVVHNHLVPSTEQPLWIVPTVGGQARRIPNVQAHDAAWMPDARHILFANESDLYTVLEDGSDLRKLASLPGRAFWLRPSPDGSELRFTLLESDSKTSALWSISAAGSGLHQLLPGWSRPATECCGSWTSDGQYFVFQSSHAGRSDIWGIAGKSQRGTTQSLPFAITNGPLNYQTPISSPQGHSLYFIGVNARPDLLVQHLPNGPFVPLIDQASAESRVEYSRDGRWMAWLNASDGALWRGRVDGSERLRLTSPPFWTFLMKWSPDNSQLLTMSQEQGKPWEIYLIDAAGGGIRRLLNEERGEADPDWSADGKSVIFGRVPDLMGNEKDPKAIYTVDLATRTVSQIPGSEGLFSPRFSPDGRFIVAIRLDQRILMIYDRAQRTWRPLSVSHGVGDPVWSHTGRYVFFQDFLEEGKPIYRIDVKTNKVEKVATLRDLSPASVLDYRLIALTPSDEPVVIVQASNVDFYSVNLDQR